MQGYCVLNSTVIMMSNFRPELSRKEIDACFKRLDIVLLKVGLPTENNGFRSCVSADEFMLMNYTYAGHARFKHRLTRNYLILNPDNTISIPVGAPFFRGFFDSALPEVNDA